MVMQEIFEMMKPVRPPYKERFDQEGNPSYEGERFFWVLLDEGCDIYGQAGKVAGNVVPSMNNVFSSRNGDQLGLSVLHDPRKNIAAVVWTHAKTKEKFAIVMTDGRSVISSDPCFFPLGCDLKGLDIGIIDNQPTVDSLGRDLPWVREATLLVKKTLPTARFGIKVEEMAKRLERKIVWASIKGRRSHF
ncbi:MAG: hypothetical protein V1858_04380 [Candidatus Gottesmanbacteria bacterium]